MHDPTATSPIPRPRAGARAWQLVDVIDFEFLLDHDRDQPLAELEERDGRIARKTAPDQPRHSQARRELFRQWLEFRRQEFAESTPLPGTTAVAAWRLLLRLVTAVALLLGASAAYGLLHYEGTQPINVATYLGWLVLIQLGLVALACLTAVIRKLGWLSAEASLVTGAVRWLWTTLTFRLNRHLLDRIPAERRSDAAAFTGSSRVMGRLYGKITLWPLVGTLQWFGICFNIAAVITTIALVVFSDRAFGWQSAVNFSPEQIHHLAQTLAAPWSWAVPAAAAPTLEQIAGSKIVLKDGIRQLTTENLVAWWPFLIAALTVYGLIPRMFLWLFSIVMGRRTLGALTFDHVSCDRLYERLTSARLQTQALGAEPTSEHPPRSSSDTPAAGLERAPNTTDDTWVLLSDDLNKQLDRATFTSQLEARLNLRPMKWQNWTEASADRKRALTALAQSNVPIMRIVLVEEAWQPPIAEKINGLRQLRKALGSSAKLIVVLLGRPQRGNLITPVKVAEFRVWLKKLQALGDPHLRVESLVERNQGDNRTS